MQNGWWQLPTGIFVIIGAQLGGRLIRYLGTTVVVRIGFLAYAIGVVLIFRAVSVDITALELFPGLAFYGIGIGFALAQLTNVVLSEIPKESSGVASGANTTVRQVGAALGVAVIGAILTTQTISHSTTQLDRSQLPAGTKSDAIAGIHALGANYSPPAGTSHAVVNVIQSAVEHGVVSGTRMALVFAFVMITIGGFISLLIPNIKVAPEVERARRAGGGLRTGRAARRGPGPDRRRHRTGRHERRGDASGPGADAFAFQELGARATHRGVRAVPALGSSRATRG